MQMQLNTHQTHPQRIKIFQNPSAKQDAVISTRS